MFEKRRRTERLEPPPLAEENDKAAEVLTVWVAPDGPQQLVLQTHWEDPAAWGLLLVDIARHAARAYEHEGHSQAVALQRIGEAFAAEWSEPTDDPEDLTDAS